MQCIDFIPLLFQADLQWDYLEQPNEAAIFRKYSYDILSAYLCCTLGARRLHSWCKAAALFWYRYNFTNSGTEPTPIGFPFGSVRVSVRVSVRGESLPSHLPSHVL